MMKCKLASLIFSLTLIAFSGRAQEASPSVTLCGKLAQGEIIKGKAAGIKNVRINGANHQVTPDGEFIFALHRDQKSKTNLLLNKGNEEKIEHTLTIAPSKWDIQNLKGVPPRKVTPSKEDEAAILSERSLVGGALKGDRIETYWQKGFIEPVSGRISGYFGGQRIMNGKKMNPHSGTDIAAPVGTPIKASGDGIVTLTAPDTFYSGNVVIIDHGHGLQTIYAHMNKIYVKQGQSVKQGEIIGEVGKTGRVTGPHLHWGASLRNTRFNPYSLLKLNKNNDSCFNL